MKELKYKNALNNIFYFDCFASLCVIFCCVFGVLMTYFFENAREFNLVIIIGVGIILGIWVFSFFIILFSQTVVITYDEIKMCKLGKEKWKIKREEIEECIYTKLKWYYFINPLSLINASSLQFKIKSKGISNKFCSLSIKQIIEIQEKFNYPIRILGTEEEQKKE